VFISFSSRGLASLLGAVLSMPVAWAPCLRVPATAEGAIKFATLPGHSPCPVASSACSMEASSTGISVISDGGEKKRTRRSRRKKKHGTLHLFIEKVNRLCTELQSYPSRFYTHCLQMTSGQ
jgi:hypothetical protein